VFGSYGWAGGAAKEIEGVLKEAGIEKAQESLGLVYAPDPADLNRCFDFGKAFASKIK
jgi:flavorubredoxin